MDEGEEDKEGMMLNAAMKGKEEARARTRRHFIGMDGGNEGKVKND